MERRPVDSSVIAAIGYDESSAILEIVFHTGRTYHYFRVPPAAHAKLLRAKSIGGYFNRRIRPRYRGVEIE